MNVRDLYKPENVVAYLRSIENNSIAGMQYRHAADEIERMGLRIKTLECERDAWRESSDAYKADLVASDDGHEYKVGDRVSHDGHITEVIGVSVKYMLCGGAVVYGHDLRPL